MIYGYPEKVVNEQYGLLQMREISFAMNAAQLRLVATFFVRVAEELESGGTFLHRHIEEIVPEWRSTQPSADLVAIPPEPMIVPEIDS